MKNRAMTLTKALVMPLLVFAPFVAPVRADDPANRDPMRAFQAAPAWITATRPLTVARRRFPGIESSARRAEPAADGTWREEGGFVILNLGGREFRLRKAERPAPHEPARALPASRSPSTRRQPAKSDGGAVEGRLLNHRRPLVDCKVALIPLRYSFFGYAVNADVAPLTTETDANGRYRFEHVPPGPYKLRWLPAGHRRWIRRLEIKPDVVVNNGSTAHAKTVRVALQTIN